MYCLYSVYSVHYVYCDRTVVMNKKKVSVQLIVNHCRHHSVYGDRARRLDWGADWGRDDKDYLPGAKLSRIIIPQNYCCLCKIA